MDVDLEQLLGAAAVDPARRPEFTKALLDGQVYVPGWLSTPPVDGKAQAGSSMQIQTWTDPDGPITPFFTSEETLRRTLAAQPEGDQRFLRLPTRDFMTMLRGQRLVLDPHGSHGKIFLPAEVEALLEGREPGRDEHVVDADREVLVGTPANLPPLRTSVRNTHRRMVDWPGNEGGRRRVSEDVGG